MKGGLCIIYTSLLTVSVLSSCALFILVVSEVLHTDDANTEPDLSGLHNVSQRTEEVGVRASESPPEELQDIQDLPKEKTEEPDQQMTFPDTLSVNSVTTDGNRVHDKKRWDEEHLHLAAKAFETSV